MLENPPPPQPDSSAVVKRYAPPNQRNRSLNRRKSGDRLDRSNSLFANDAEKNQHVPSRNIPVLDHFDIGSSNLMHENSHPRLIALEGCYRSEASQLLNERWAQAMHNYNDTSVDLSERPAMYSGSSASAWGHSRLPHQFMLQANSGPSSGSQMDFLSELRRAIRDASPNSDN
ncbi:uncharacterized protein LOC8288304 isoform X1 [Ricinus communis]|uniref:Uncharacterized protein n=1 Tax=Ricinus communis TaxID=3988 RepID=B9SEZ9_RICCO|nr:uncharacterized protein LOC8288304 isoform X1 [Ricinus communis]EEF37776.1 conserved hypothetical protein [Ricinus communis]|eukprot:XP_002524568.1 uncharacterized protein LOC8288304 isoform X1 [Ricinus communis]